MFIGNSYGPLKHALPLSLADKTYSAPEVDRSDTAIRKNGGPSEAHEMTAPGGTRKTSQDNGNDNEEYEGLTDRQRRGTALRASRARRSMGLRIPRRRGRSALCGSRVTVSGSRRKRSGGAARQASSAVSRTRR
ncbi:hypothetical protein K438DRAFT_727091 [Mycena galopus ATCC 62051]|nr:hypothetical protein K438DRAFT_727091 [Mycena galopus ATCC 62051]